MFLDHPPSLFFPQPPPLEDPPRQPLLLRKVLHCSFYFEARNVKTKSYFLLLLPVLATWAGSFSSSLEFVFFVKTSLDAVHHCHNHLLMLIIVKKKQHYPPIFLRSLSLSSWSSSPSSSPLPNLHEKPDQLALIPDSLHFLVVSHNYALIDNYNLSEVEKS